MMGLVPARERRAAAISCRRDGRALAARGESIREPTDQTYSDRSAAVSDRWGNEWWLATHIKDVAPA
jgi:uncharacterized glyoxalase superfamily protein PhnB